MVTIHAGRYVDLMRLGVKRGKLDNVSARRVELDSLIDVQDADFVAGTRADRNTGSLRPGRWWSIHVLITSDSCDVRGVSCEGCCGGVQTFGCYVTLGPASRRSVYRLAATTPRMATAIATATPEITFAKIVSPRPNPTP